MFTQIWSPITCETHVCAQERKLKENKNGDIFFVALSAYLKSLHQLLKKLAYFAIKLAYDNFIIKNQLVINLKSPCLTIM